MPEPIRFLLNGAPIDASGVAPQTTLLDFLREHRGLTGTKEGCAEGDCGACTVVIAERGPDALRWQPVNACIRLLPSVDGKAVFTVESLAAADGTLHPVQQAMVDAHASQCGFCTPGFVMSLFALYKTAPAPTRDAACEALSGNLCRCTGYRPILDAAQAMHALPAPEDWRAPLAQRATVSAVAAAASLDTALAAIARRATFEYSADGQRWRAPRTLDGLLAACAEQPDARIVAGATDIGLWVTKEQRALGDLVYVGDVAELVRIDRHAHGLTIGAAVSLADAFAALDDAYPELHETSTRFASPPIRASGTLGGNVANGSPIGDSMPALIALGAEVELASTVGTRRLPLEDYYIGYRATARAPGEVLVAIHVPPRAAHLLLRAYKVSKRRDQDISGVFACFALTFDGDRVATARIGCGGVAAVPARARRTEAVLAGARFDAATTARAAEALASEFDPLDDLRASAAYRRTVLGNLVRRLALEHASSAAPLRVEQVVAG